MITSDQIIQDLVDQEYRYGFVTDLEAESVPPGLDEEIIRLISAKKEEPEFMRAWRLRALRHWLTLREQERLADVAVDAVFDSVSVATTFKAQVAPDGAKPERLCRQALSAQAESMGKGDHGD